MKAKSRQAFALLVVLMAMSFITWLFLPHVQDSDAHASIRSSMPAQNRNTNATNGENLLPSVRNEEAIFQIASAQIIEQSHTLQGWGALFDGGGGPQMSPHQASALKLSELQRIEVNKALMGAFNQMKKLQYDHVTLQSQTETEVHLTIKAFPQKGADLKEKLRLEIEQIIGEKDGPLIWEIMDAPLQKSFRKFGSIERDIIGRTLPNGYNEVTEDGVTRGFPFAVSFDSLQQSLFRFEEVK
jgi:hypothetical protein